MKTPPSVYVVLHTAACRMTQRGGERAHPAWDNLPAASNLREKACRTKKRGSETVCRLFRYDLSKDARP